VSSTTPPAAPSRRQNIRVCCGKSASEAVLIRQKPPSSGSIELRWRWPAIAATTLPASPKAASASAPPSDVSSGLCETTTTCRSPAAASRSRSHPTCSSGTTPREPPSRRTVSSTIARTRGPMSNV
jgi:hypothetical protein